MPVFPSSKSLDEWLLSFKEFRKHLDESSVIIGQGFGRLVVLKILEEKLRPVRGALFLSGNDVESIFDVVSFSDFDFSDIKVKAGEFFVYSSEQDSSQSLKESEVLANAFDDDVLVLDEPAYFKSVDTFEDLLIDVLSLTDS